MSFQTFYFYSFNYSMNNQLAETWNMPELVNPSQQKSSLHLFVDAAVDAVVSAYSFVKSAQDTKSKSQNCKTKEFCCDFILSNFREELSSCPFCDSVRFNDQNKLRWLRSASCVCLRAVSAAFVSGSDWVSQSVAAVNGGSVAEQRALSRLTDQEHEVITWCSLDIVSVLSQSFPPTCDSPLAAAQCSFQGWHFWRVTSIKTKLN